MNRVDRLVCVILSYIYSSMQVGHCINPLLELKETIVHEGRPAMTHNSTNAILAEHLQRLLIKIRSLKYKDDEKHFRMILHSRYVGAHCIEQLIDFIECYFARSKMHWRFLD
jgi:hypothetical protein